ncbi:hypothetical protein JCM8097_000541 [Rhodosporidiobolus ruineniae]
MSTARPDHSSPLPLPTVVVQPVHPFAAPAVASPQLGTFASTPAVPPPVYAPGDWRTAAEQEKDAYLASSGSDEGHWADAPPARALPPPLSLQAPKAAFASAPSSPRSPISLKQAMAFGDVSSVKSGGGTAEKEVGRGAAEVRKSGLDWDRFDLRVKQQEGEKQSAWLQSKTRSSKKWFVLGWLGTLCVLIAIAAGLAYHFTHKTGDTEPSVPSLGGLNEKNVTGTASTSLLASAATSSRLFGASTASSSARTAQGTSISSLPTEDDSASSPVQVAASTVSSRTSSSSAARTASSPTTTTPRTTSTTSTSAASTRTSTPSSLGSSTGTTTRASHATSAADEDRRRVKRFGAWREIEWKAHSPIAVDGERRRSDWREIEFSAPSKLASKEHRRRSDH